MHIVSSSATNAHRWPFVVFERLSSGSVAIFSRCTDWSAADTLRDSGEFSCRRPRPFQSTKMPPLSTAPDAAHLAEHEEEGRYRRGVAVRCNACDDCEEARRQLRRIRNREHAARSRKRQREYVLDLERRVSALENHNNYLSECVRMCVREHGPGHAPGPMSPLFE